MAKKKDRSAQFALYLRAEGIKGFEREHMFAKEIGRRWRFDFAWPHTYVVGEFRLAVEIEGITGFGRRKAACKSCGAPIPGDMVLGRHQTAKGIQEDCEKYEAALDLGWIVYRVTQHMMAEQKTFDLIRKLIGQPTDKQSELELPTLPF